MKTHETLAQQEFVARQLRRRQMVVLARLFLFLSVLVLWEACARTGVINAFIFSSPSRIVRCFFSMVLDGSIFLHTGVTILETLVSFFFVTAVGILGAVALWSSKSLAEILDPYLVMLNSLPKSALAPILIVWLGSSMRTIVAAAVSVAVFGSILTLHNGFMSMDPDQARLIRSLGGGKREILFKVLLPGSVPLIISNMKVNVGLCLVGVIIGGKIKDQPRRHPSFYREAAGISFDILNPVLQEALWIKIKICFMDADSNDILDRKDRFEFASGNELPVFRTGILIAERIAAGTVREQNSIYGKEYLVVIGNGLQGVADSCERQA